jgi:chemotaxis protein methyltransferase CheR
MNALGIDSVAGYRRYLEAQPGEWRALDALCPITISRFCRDKGVFDLMRTSVLPTLAGACLERGGGELRAWSAGCGSGEEPYTLAIIWDAALRPLFTDLRLSVLATDASPAMVARAAAACYEARSLKELPQAWRARAFERTGRLYSLHQRYRAAVELRQQDLRQAMPEGPFDLILCRNLAFTYFEPALQETILLDMAKRLRLRGALVVGAHERLPMNAVLERWSSGHPVYRKVRE